VLSTLAYLVLYSLLRGGMGAQLANALSLGLTAVANTAANRRYTFGVRGSEGAMRHQAQGLIAFLAALVVTSGSLALLHAFAHPAHVVELAVLILANLAATVLRFVLLRGWVFRKGKLK
jgi:putative flippase GtrA